MFTISKTITIFPEDSGRLAHWPWDNSLGGPRDIHHPLQMSSSESQTECAYKGSGWPGCPAGSLTL